MFRRSIKKRSNMPSFMMQEVVDSVRLCKLTYEEAGKKHGISASLVGRLNRECGADGKIPEAIRAREEKRRQKLRHVIEHSFRHLESKDGLANAE